MVFTTLDAAVVSVRRIAVQTSTVPMNGPDFVPYCHGAQSALPASISGPCDRVVSTMTVAPVVMWIVVGTLAPPRTTGEDLARGTALDCGTEIAMVVS